MKYFPSSVIWERSIIVRSRIKFNSTVLMFTVKIFKYNSHECKMIEVKQTRSPFIKDTQVTAK